MRRLWPGVLLLLLTGSAAGQPYSLSDGVFIVHQVPELAYSTEPPAGDWCRSYLPYAIDDCDAQRNRIDPAGATRAVWFVLAAWYDAKTWCGVEFGLGDYDPALFDFEAFGPCFASEGLEIPMDGWPGPGTGTALAATDEAWSGNFLPVYFFTGYAYSEPTPGVMPLAPSAGSGFAGTADCRTPPQAWPAVALGGLGIGTDGIFACPVQPEPGCCWIDTQCYVTWEDECEQMGGHWVPPEYCFAGARDCGSVGPPRICCIDEQCFFMVEQQCADEGGEYHPEWDSCAHNPCAVPGCCWIGEQCYVTSEDDCGLMGGHWVPPEYCFAGARDCGSVGPPRICCMDELCFFMVEQQCMDEGGEYHPEWSSCDGNPCHPQTEWHVCCVGETCRLLTDPDPCAGMQGVWHPEWDSCDGNPCDTLPPLAACCIGLDCTVLTRADCLAQGGVWMASWDCEPNFCSYLPPPPRVCCVAEQCVLVPTEEACQEAGGFLRPFSPDCDPDPCAQPLPGCCYVGEVCYVTLETECLAMGGVWIPPDYCFGPGRDCGVGPPQLCCIEDRCYFLVEQQCLDLGGTVHPGWSSCDPNPCGGGVPAPTWSWGTIKALYR